MAYNQCQYLREYNKESCSLKNQCDSRGYEHFSFSALGAPLIIYVCDEHLFFIKVKHD